jgi:hypothetical protein
MKAKLYNLLTGLLMGACITSYGQEIVSEFTLRNGNLFSDIDIMECSDGTLLTSIYQYNSNYDAVGFLICKTTTEGQLLDSIQLDYGKNLWAINGEADSFVTSGYLWDEVDSTLSFRMTFIDADLNVTNEVLVPILVENSNTWSVEDAILDPLDNFIITYWTDYEIIDYWTSGGVFHLKRISLDGTIITESETNELLPSNWSNMHPSDTALTYWDQSFRVFDEAPLCYYKLGGYIGTDDSHPWPLYTYFFDENLHLTNTIVYDYVAEDTYYDWVGDEHLILFEKSTFKETYLMAAQIHYPDNRFETSLVKYDMDHNVLATAKIEPSSPIGYGNPIETVVADGNSIFHAYNTRPSTYSEAVGLVRLDNDLNILWNIVLPGGQYNFAYGKCLKVLQNGDVAIAFYTTYGNSGDKLYLFIIHDGYDTTPELIMTKCPFTLCPNPVKDLLTLRFDDGDEPESVELYDLAGRLVGTKPNGLESIDMRAMPSGVYMLRVTMKDETIYHEKVLKE